MIMTTTARDAERETKKLGRRLAELIPHSLYVPRGVKGIDKIVTRARNKGYSRICIIERNKMNFIDVNARKWEWLPKEIKIKAYKIEDNKQKVSELNAEGNNELLELFNVTPNEDGDVLLKITKDTILFTNDDELLKIEIGGK